MSQSSRGWIGVDLDGTLAHYDRWRGAAHIGAPVPRMAARVKGWLDAGRTVKIFTARVACDYDERAEVIAHIHAWLKRNGMPPLEVTCQKDFEMVELWDDRAVQVVPNTGERADGRQT
jgi:hypothetical protein